MASTGYTAQNDRRRQARAFAGRPDLTLEAFGGKEHSAHYFRAMSILGKEWVWQILRVLLDGPCRFGDFRERIRGLPDPILSERLEFLEAKGFVQRRVLPETPLRLEYALTPRGQGLREVLLLLHHWAETWGDKIDLGLPRDELLVLRELVGVERARLATARARVRLSAL